MKKLIILSFVILASCQKQEAQPSAESEKVATPTRIKSVMNYSNTVNSNLTSQDIQAQSSDTTYYEIYKNGVIALTYKANWNFNSGVYSVENLYSLMSISTGDELTWYIIHRTPRNVTSYSFNGAITTDEKTIITGQFYPEFQKSGVYFKPGFNSFVQAFSYKVD